MKWSEMQAAVADAKSEIERADKFVAEMAAIVRDRLRAGNVGVYTLRKLKRELQNFNAVTGSWRG